MEQVVRLLQIKTTRSAWIFLFGSTAMLFFGVYLLLGGFNSPGTASVTTSGFALLLLFAPWFLISLSYIAIALWVLFGVRGRQCLAIEQQRMAQARRNLLWYGKFLFACYAAAFASFVLLGILALPFVDYRVLDVMFRPYGGYYMLFLGFFWAPVIFRYLK